MTDSREEDRELESRYDRLAEKAHELFEQGRDRSAEVADKAVQSAAEQLVKAGEFTQEQGERLTEWMRRDLHHFADDLRGMKDEARDRLEPQRLKAGALSGLSRVLHAAGEALNGLADRADRARAFATGEVTSAGTLQCDACETEMRFKDTTRIPPCPKCHHTSFKKHY